MLYVVQNLLLLTFIYDSYIAWAPLLIIPSTVYLLVAVTEYEDQ
jgi:hypothetical protein